MTTLLFAGGGTGGHVFPLIAVADAVRALRPDVTIVFVGTERGMETKVVPARGYRLEAVRVVPMRGNGFIGALRGALQAARAIPEALSLVRRHAPRAVFSVGGYAAGPVSVAAKVLGVPLALVEPNSAIGLANRLVAPLVSRAYTAFSESETHFAAGRALRTGVPIRDGFSPAPYSRGEKLRVLVLGGSQGAASLNQAVPRALASLAGKVTVVHQAGAGRDLAVRALYDELGASAWASVVPFIDDVPRALADADLVVGRAGASAIAEICAVGRPSLLIPYPFAGDHQRHNAESLTRARAAVTVLAKDATAERLADELHVLERDPARLTRMAESARALGRPGAATVIARDLLKLAGISGDGNASAGGDSGGLNSDNASGQIAASSGFWGALPAPRGSLARPLPPPPSAGSLELRGALAPRGSLARPLPPPPSAGSRSSRDYEVPRV